MDDSFADKATVIYRYEGTVAEDLAPDTVILKVLVPQLMPAQEGEVNAAENESSYTVPTIGGGQDTATVKAVNYFPAYWEAEDPYLQTPPLVKKGEQVQVYKYADAPRLYWKPSGRDLNLRQLDRRRVVVSATPKIGVPPTDESCYVQDIDAGAKSVYVIKTSKANGEKFAYVIHIDTETGILTLTDDVKNSLTIESASNTVSLRNKDGCLVQLAGRNVNIVAVDDLTLRAGRQVVVDAKTITVRALEGAGAVVLDCIGFTLKAGKSAGIAARTLMVTAAAKFDKTLVAASVRSGRRITYGALGTGYAVPSTNIADGTGNVPDPIPDVADGPDNYRHAAAYEQLVEMADIIVTAFNQVRGVINVPTNHTSLTGKAEASKMLHLRDQ